MEEKKNNIHKLVNAYNITLSNKNLMWRWVTGHYRLYRLAMVPFVSPPNELILVVFKF